MSVEFETPENILIHYEPAGLGTRFLAWMIDWAILIVPFVIIFIAVLINLDYFKPAAGDVEDKVSLSQGVLFAAVLYFLVWGMVTVVYFGVFELLMRGQTPGKKIMKIRVVRIQGFTLDAASIAVRTIFRIIDNLPILWVVALISRQSQRLGDIVAKTIVISDRVEDPALTQLKETLCLRDRKVFINRFDAFKLKTVPEQAIRAAELALLRWESLSDSSKVEIINALCAPLAEMFALDTPTLEKAQVFFEEFLASEYQRQYRQLG